MTVIWPVDIVLLKKESITAAAVSYTPLYDYLIAMEERNRRNMLRILGSDPEHKVSLLLDYTDCPGNIADPWYTGDFEITYRDIVKGCEGFIEYLVKSGRLL